MKPTSLYNKIFFAFIALLYLNFYLVSPYFHYHENSIRGHAKENYHSHLLNKIAQKKNATECHHPLNQSNEHNHPIVINAVVTNLSPRIVDTLHSTLISTIIIILEFQNESDETKYTEDFHFGKILKEKCVHSASNVSPPFVIAV